MPEKLLVVQFLILKLYICNIHLDREELNQLPTLRRSTKIVQVDGLTSTFIGIESRLGETNGNTPSMMVLPLQNLLLSLITARCFLILSCCGA